MTLNDIAKKMCAKGKGILAADESTGTIAKRFKSINVENLEKNRLNFRQTLFSSSAMKDYIGGVILFDETNYLVILHYSNWSFLLYTVKTTLVL